jgi:hypothetical protein
MGQQTSVRAKTPIRIKPVPGHYGVRIVRRNCVCVYSKQQLYSFLVSLPNCTVAHLAAELPPFHKLYLNDQELPLTSSLQDLGISEASLIKLVADDDSASTAGESSQCSEVEAVTVRRLNSETADSNWCSLDLSAYAVPDLRLEASYQFSKRKDC